MPTELIAKINLRSQPDQLKQLRHEVKHAVDNLPYTTKERDCIVLAVNEACMNIIQHAYGGEGNGVIILEIFSSNKDIIFRLTDYAKPVDTDAIKSRDLGEIRPGGLGVHLIKQVMDEVRFIDGAEKAGNILEMKKRIPEKRSTI